ncbi:site-specific integrase [Gandjariella thermophila]|uniref:Tyr recombinase domain-containing protein n=1 Tax=Gandjariella thermophila TaxID=1931992 RepID=A0A4D4JCA5_9PSEU|nr:site-specific integrase [Gandjariella thermophila]GDY31493.1 hypothetical protein GTS_31260 [Gandjariella thermophila]
MVLLATFGSLRFAEMVGLQRSDFDLDRCRVRVERQAVQTDAGELLTDTPKSEAGKRRVSLPRFLLPEIKRHLRAYVGDPPDAWVFVEPKGGRPTRANFHPLWNEARTAAGIPHLHLHDLRHTGNTIASETGATLQELMARMGHSSTRAALIYLHAREERDQAIALGIDRMVSMAAKHPASDGVDGPKGGKGHAEGTKKAPKRGNRPRGTTRKRSTSKNAESG